jgi:tetraacyldisaccharide 4'-kinase
MNIFNKKWPACVLLPFSALYLAITVFRNLLYDHRILPICKLPTKVISVGNLTVGGTGKTPTVAFLAKHYIDQGKKIAILSRGYGRKSREQLLVCDGKDILESWQKTGDEPYMLAKRLCVPVLVDADRCRGGQTLVRDFKPDIILLDDAFQHRKLYRDVDIVTFNGQNCFGNGYLLPAGPLRESKRSLKRADIVWINSSINRNQQLPGSREKSIRARYSAKNLVSDSRKIPCRGLRDQNIIAVSGIANPENFIRTLKALGANILKSFQFRDHHNYRSEEIRTIESQSKRLGLHWIVTTEKDWYKLTPFMNQQLWYYLNIEIELLNPKDLDNYWLLNI